MEAFRVLGVVPGFLVDVPGFLVHVPGFLVDVPGFLVHVPGFGVFRSVPRCSGVPGSTYMPLSSDSFEVAHKLLTLGASQLKNTIVV